MKKRSRVFGLLLALWLPAAQAAEVRVSTAAAPSPAARTPAVTVKEEAPAPKNKPPPGGFSEGPVFETLLWGSGGAVAGSLAGPPGAVVGAAVGAVVGFAVGLVMKRKIRSPAFRDSKRDAKGP